MELNSFLFPAP
jgi:pimeloyl-ACP methyl ester carboxylesterase